MKNHRKTQWNYQTKLNMLLEKLLMKMEYQLEAGIAVEQIRFRTIYLVFLQRVNHFQANLM